MYLIEKRTPVSAHRLLCNPSTEQIVSDSFYGTSWTSLKLKKTVSCNYIRHYHWLSENDSLLLFSENSQGCSRDFWFAVLICPFLNSCLFVCLWILTSSVPVGSPVPVEHHNPPTPTHPRESRDAAWNWPYIWPVGSWWMVWWFLCVSHLFLMSQ